jgi:Outer membrane lipoprotein-sorting protein
VYDKCHNMRSRLLPYFKKVDFMRARIALLIPLTAAWMFFSPNLRAQTSTAANSPGMTASQIVAKMVSMNQQRADALKGFTSERTYELDYHGFPSHKEAKVVVDVDFKAPKDKQLKIVSEEGSELLRKHVLHKLVESELEASDRAAKESTALTDANYEFSLVGREQKDGRDCYVLEVKPRTKSKFLYEGRVWVDAAEFAVVHIQARPAKNPSFWIKRTDIEHRYEKVGFFWLPASNRSTSSTRFGGHAILTIDYGTYKVQPDAPSIAEQGPVQGGVQ